MNILINSWLLLLMSVHALLASQNVKLHQPRESSLLRIVPFTRYLNSDVWNKYVLPYLTVHSCAPNLGSISLKHPMLAFNDDHPRRAVTTIRFSDDDSKIATVLCHQNVHVRDAFTGKALCIFKLQGEINDIQFNRSGTLLATACSSKGNGTQVLDVQSGNVKASFSDGHAVNGITFYTDDDHLAVSTARGIEIINILAQQIIKRFNIPKNPYITSDSIHSMSGPITFDHAQSVIHIYAKHSHRMVTLNLKTEASEVNSLSYISGDCNSYMVRVYNGWGDESDCMWRTTNPERDKFMGERDQFGHLTHKKNLIAYLTSSLNSSFTPITYHIRVMDFDIYDPIVDFDGTDNASLCFNEQGNKIVSNSWGAKVQVWDLSALTYPLTMEQVVLLSLLTKEKNEQIIPRSLCLKALAEKHAVDHQDLRRAVLTIGNVQLRDAIITNYKLQEFMKQPEITAGAKKYDAIASTATA